MKKLEIEGQLSPDLLLDVEVLIEQSGFAQAEKCERGAPFIFFVDGAGIGRIVQGCCNNWMCSRCGQIRARTEYGVMVEGAKILAERGVKLYMHTWTCRGRELGWQEAEQSYGKWTNAMLNSCRDRAKSQGDDWFYTQVTERQTRKHPHSHLIASFLPGDATLTTVRKRDKNGEWVNRDVYISQWYEKRLKAAGLGEQYDITEVRNNIAVAVYAAKYLFKDAIFTEWPPKWKRIRYSQSWPKNPEHGKPEIAYPLILQRDWYRVTLENVPVVAQDEISYEAAKRHGISKVRKTK